MKHRIRAYTLMEITVAMLMSAICITICYTAYSLITEYYRSFQQQNEETDAILSLKHVMESDLVKSRYCMKTEEGIVLVQDTVSINYLFRPDFMLRKVGELHTDTFKLRATLPQSFFEDNEILEDDTIDKIQFSINLLKKGVIPLQLKKHYSAENLFK